MIQIEPVGNVKIDADVDCERRENEECDADDESAAIHNPDPVCADCGHDLPLDGYCGCATAIGGEA